MRVQHEHFVVLSRKRNARRRMGEHHAEAGIRTAERSNINPYALVILDFPGNG